MKGFLTALAVACVLIGLGDILTAPAATETHLLDLTYDVLDVADTTAETGALPFIPTLPTAKPVSMTNTCSGGRCSIANRSAATEVKRETTRLVTRHEEASLTRGERHRRPIAGAVRTLKRALRPRCR